jgi:hypothetical protein
MPTLQGLFIGVDGAKAIGKIPDSRKAADFLLKLSYLFSREFPCLTGQPTSGFSSLSEPDKYVIHLEAKLGKLEAGYYLLIGSTPRQELEALLHS